MAYFEIVVAWLIIILPFGWAGYTFYKALDTGEGKWVVTFALSLAAVPLYFMILVQIGKDLAG